MALSDRIVGGAMLATAAFVFVYYTIWALVMPFFPASSPLHDAFPAREWAVRLPALTLVVGLASIGAFVGAVMQKEARKRREKEARRAA